MQKQYEFFNQCCNAEESQFSLKDDIESIENIIAENYSQELKYFFGFSFVKLNVFWGKSSHILFIKWKPLNVITDNHLLSFGLPL